MNTFNRDHLDAIKALVLPFQAEARVSNVFKHVAVIGRPFQKGCAVVSQESEPDHLGLRPYLVSYHPTSQPEDIINGSVAPGISFTEKCQTWIKFTSFITFLIGSNCSTNVFSKS